MTSESVQIISEDGVPLHGYKWCKDGDRGIKGVVQIAHGMAEHGKRYEPFALALLDNGYQVYANDHRGHGKTAGSIENLGYFADKNGWDLVVRDMHLLTHTIKSNHPDLPVFIFGHSMGSFLARDYITRYSKEIGGVILSGTAGDQRLEAGGGIVLTALLSLFKGRKTKSRLMDKLSFGSFNKAFEPAETPFDWLSRDKDAVNSYINDPYCGTVFTLGFFNDLFQGLKRINASENYQKVDKNLPIYFISGDKDPVGGNTKGVRRIIDHYKQAGVKDVTYKFYKDGRHEMLKEVNREEVISDVMKWLDSHV